MPNLEVQEKVDTYVDLVNNTWGQRLGNSLRKDYGNVEIFSTSNAKDILNKLVEYFNNTSKEDNLNKFDPDNNALDKKYVEAFKEFLNYSKKKTN